MSGYGTQPFTGINQKPLVFAQIRQGVSAPEVSKARVVESARVIDISSNRFLHLFYRKPYMSDMGYDHGLDGLATFRVKTSPDARLDPRGEILAAGPFDVGNTKNVALSERQFLTMSDCSSWEFKPSVKVADFFANSLGVPIECWTPCSRIQMARELEEADLIKFELECGAGESQDCAMTAGELALALNEGDASDFDPFDDLHGNVQLSVLFVNAHPDIQPLDFRLRMNIKRCECEPLCYVHAGTAKIHKVVDGKELKSGDLARLGYNQTCLGFNVQNTDGSTVQMAMKYALFGAPSGAFFDFKSQATTTAKGVQSVSMPTSTSLSASASEDTLASDAGRHEVTLTSTGGGNGAKAVVTVNGSNAITAVSISAVGSGYAVNDVLSIPADSLGDSAKHDAVALPALTAADLTNVEDYERRGEGNADDVTGLARGMDIKLALSDVWCTRAGELIGVSRGQETEGENGEKYPVFELKTDGAKRTNYDAAETDYVDAEGRAMTKATHAAYHKGADAVAHAPRKQWRDEHHYAGAASDHWGSKSETVDLGATLGFTIVGSGGNAAKNQDGNEINTASLLIDGLDAAVGKKGKLVDTSTLGDATMSLPEVVEERLFG